MRKIPEGIHTIINEARREFSALYRNRMKQMILYGSYARGDYTSGSDVDIALILDRIDDFSRERERYVRVLKKLSLKHDTLVSAVILDQRNIDVESSPLVLNIKREGIPL
jgi:predicted nucleotidyltransferase